MRIYFSGGRGLTNTPEVLIPRRKPHVMLTFIDMQNNGTLNRFNVYLSRITGRSLKFTKQRKPRQKAKRNE